MIRYIELFAGVGGFRAGIERALDNCQKQPEGDPLLQNSYDNTNELERNPIPVCVFANEWDKYAASTYNKNYGGRIDQRDITTIPTGSIPDHDLLVGGFPCQAFSVAGKRRGFDETRGTLFFEVARILKDKKPQHLLLENVKGLLSHDSGRTFQTILGVLADLGYRVEWQVLNSKDFGVPQNRERIFIVGHLGVCCGREILPIIGTGGAYLGENSSEGEDSKPARALRSHIGGVDLDDQLIGEVIGNGANHPQDRYYNPDGVSPTLNSGSGGGLRSPKVGVIDHEAFRETDQALTIDKSYHKGPDNHGQRPVILTGSPRYEDGHRHQPLVAQRQPLRFLERNQKKIEGDYSFTVDAGQTSGVRLGTRIRRLTPVECERLQGFPDNWTAGMSDTQRYKQMGNAVTVNVIEAIIRRLYAHSYSNNRSE